MATNLPVQKIIKQIATKGFNINNIHVMLVSPGEHMMHKITKRM